jgi:hypothetical protein
MLRNRRAIREARTYGLTINTREIRAAARAVKATRKILNLKEYACLYQAVRAANPAPNKGSDFMNYGVRLALAAIGCSVNTDITDSKSGVYTEITYRIDQQYGVR